MQELWRPGMTALLDLVCCAFAGALLMFLIAISSDQSGAPAFKSNTVLVRCQHIAGPKAEVGIEYKSPWGDDWQRMDWPETPLGKQNREKTVKFSARSKPQSGAFAFLLFIDPPPGAWSFRPYLVDFPSAVKNNDPFSLDNPIASQRGSTVVELTVVGQHVTMLKPGGPAPLQIPGDTGPEVNISIESPNTFR